ncbi:MAG: EamA family transporter, partial [Aeromonas sobria]
LLVNLLLWGKDTDLTRLAIGGLLMLASLWVCQRHKVNQH